MLLSIIRQRKLVIRLILLVLFAVVCVYAFTLEPLAYIREFLGENYLLSAAVYTLGMYIATVVAPVAILPLTPSVAVILGPLPTALLSVFGWTLGAVTAFLIARHLGRPVVGKFVSLASLERYERMIPETATFWWLVVLRMLLPVDVLSYAIGLLSKMPLSTYTLATIVGVLPGSFIFSYLGPAVFEGEYFLLAAFAVFAVFLFTVAYYYVRRGRRTKTQ